MLGFKKHKVQKKEIDRLNFSKMKSFGLQKAQLKYANAKNIHNTYKRLVSRIYKKILINQ